MKEYQNTVVVVEDDEAISMMLKEIFTEMGYNVVQCHVARDIWKILHSIIPDLITLDYWIGSANGISLCDDIRADKEFDAIPILFMSAGDVNKDDFKSCQNVTFLDKPFRIDELKDKVVKILKVASSRFR